MIGGHLQKVLRAHGYPESLRRKRRMIRHGPHNRLAPKEQPRVFCVLPFIPGVSQRIGRVLKMAGMRVSLQPVSTLNKALWGVKNKLPRKGRAGVVAVITCGCGADDVEETGRTLCQRIAEHCKAFECNYPNRSANAKLKAGHTPLWDGVSVLGSTPNRTRRRILEAWHSEETVTDHAGGGGFTFSFWTSLA